MRPGQKVKFVTKTDGNIPYAAKGKLLKLDTDSASVIFPKIGTWTVSLNEIEAITKKKTKSKGKKK